MHEWKSDSVDAVVRATNVEAAQVRLNHFAAKRVIRPIGYSTCKFVLGVEDERDVHGADAQRVGLRRLSSRRTEAR